MEYRDFVEQVKEQIQDFLPEKFADAAVEVNQIVKNNDCVLDGLMVRTEESNISPTIYLNPYFEQIQDGAELDDILAQIASVYQSHYIDHDIDVSEVTDFDKIKEKIVCKLINEEANQQFLQDKPYSKLEDLAVVYQILMDKTGEGTATIRVEVKPLFKDSKDTKAIFGRYLRLNYIFKDPGDIIVDNLYTNLTNKFAELRRKRGAITRAELEAVVNSAISKGNIFSGLSLSVGYSKIENGYVENEQKVKKEI